MPPPSFNASQQVKPEDGSVPRRTRLLIMLFAAVVIAWLMMPTPEEEEAFKAPIRQRYEDEGSPYHATAQMWDDGIIDPVQTRDVLGLAISASLNAPVPRTRFGVFRM